MTRTQRRLRRRGSTEDGFTLMEVAISALVVGMGFVSILGIFSVGLKWAQDVRVRLNGQMIAQTASYAGGAGTTLSGGGVLFEVTGAMKTPVKLMDRGGTEICQLHTPQL